MTKKMWSSGGKAIITVILLRSIIIIYLFVFFFFEGAFRSVGVDKDFYRQISLIEGDQPQESNVGKVSDMYTTNPLPEYSYKESDYSEGSDSHSNNAGYDKNNPLEMLKSPFEMPKNE